MTHSPICQYKGCNKVANDYDRRFGRLIFFCNTRTSFHDPRSGYSSTSFTKSVNIRCENCKHQFSETVEEETLDEFECPNCGVSSMLGIEN